MSLVEKQHAFYSERVPVQFNRTLTQQRSNATGSEAEERILNEMQAVRASIVVQIDAGDRLIRHAFDIERGEMSAVESPAYLPFLILGHALSDYENLRRECGESLLGFLGGLAGLGERFGADGFALFAHFGEAEISPEPRSIIRIDADTYADLRAGLRDPQDAFLGGRVEILGDEEMAIGLALAAMSPD
jgi:hypothetical protein